ncbi:hypothetical protein [Streptomyces sp. NPDC086182]|jgi:hypothetical protein|uniref:hypothetical protein n=1 Tax=Streptomyces sp. NPDC086182 TaxID=3155058 RepID=UPI00344A5629
MTSLASGPTDSASSYRPDARNRSVSSPSTSTRSIATPPSSHIGTVRSSPAHSS